MKRITNKLVIGSILLLISLSGAEILHQSHFNPAISRQMPQSPPAGNGVDYVLVIVMENHGLNFILGNSSAPYLNQLANTYSLLTKYSYVGSPSLPNYLALLGGSTFGCTSDVDPNSNTCTSNAWKSKNLVDNLEAAGYSWKAYMEDMPSNCYSSDSGKYYVRHNPFVYFDDISSNTARCSRVVPAGVSDSVLVSDLQSTTNSSNFMWLTPNGCNDMHDCPVSTGDNYLGTLVPQILNSSVFKTQKAALFLTFDESSSSDNYVYAVWAGPAVKPAFQSSNSYSHYSLIKTLEATWSLTTLSTQENTGAAPMTEVLSSYTSSPMPPPTGPSTTFWAIVAAILVVVTVGLALVVRKTRKNTQTGRP